MQPAAGQRRDAGRMVGRAEGAPVGQRAIGQVPGDGLHHRDLQQFARGERRQDRGQALRQHGFAGAGRAAHQQVVATGRDDFQRALGGVLPLHVAQVGQHHLAGANGRSGARQHLRALEVVAELDQRRRGQDVHVPARPGRFRPAGPGADQPMSPPIGGNSSRQHTCDSRDRAIQRQLAQHGEVTQRIRWNGADRPHDAERDGQIEMAALLGQVCGGKIDDHALGRHRQPRGGERGAHTLARFSHRLVGQPHEYEGHAAAGHLHLHIHGPGLDALERNRRNPRDHHASPVWGNGSVLGDVSKSVP